MQESTTTKQARPDQTARNTTYLVRVSLWERTRADYAFFNDVLETAENVLQPDLKLPTNAQSLLGRRDTLLATEGESRRVSGTETSGYPKFKP
jgi:hypothetical protein